MAKDYVKAITMQNVDSTGIAIDTWTAFDTGGIEEACFFIRITNDSDTNVFISYDGINDHEYVQDGNRIDINIQTNSSPGNYVAKLRKGTVVYVRGTAGQSGLIYLSGYYNG